MPAPLLEVQDLRIHFPTDDGLVKAVDGVSFSLDRGQTLGIVGESGSGKSVTSLGIMGLHHGTSARSPAQIRLDGEELVGADAGAGAGAARQQDGDDLPGPAVVAASRTTRSATRSPRRTGSTTRSSKQAGPPARHRDARPGRHPAARGRVDAYPHQFSGGMRQRVMIAMALSCDPELLIADEPTTALDVTVQAQILDLISDLQAEFGSAVIIITHDLGVVAELSDDILVMYAGRVAEYGTAEDIFGQPGPSLHLGAARLDAAPRPGAVNPAHPDPGHAAQPDQGPARLPVPPALPLRRLTDGRSETEVPPLREVDAGHLAACHLTAVQRAEQLGRCCRRPEVRRPDAREPVSQGGAET